MGRFPGSEGVRPTPGPVNQRKNLESDFAIPVNQYEGRTQDIKLSGGRNPSRPAYLGMVG